MKNKSFFSGLSGIQLNNPKKQFPEADRNSSRLTLYSRFFNSVEINSSFYKIPKFDTVAKWADSVPDDFCFTFKLFKGISHSRELNYEDDMVTQFFDSIGGVKTKRGCILIQFPPGLSGNNLTKLILLLQHIKKINHTEWNIAVEFRNNSWYNEKTFDLLNSLNVALVVHDLPLSATPENNLPTDFLYFRFHGPAGNYRGSYTKDFLMKYAELAISGIYENKSVYMYFNNTMGEAFNNLTTINEIIYNKITSGKIAKQIQ